LPYLLSKSRKGLIFAADFVEEKKCLTCIDEIAEFIDGIKIGNLLALSTGLKIVRKIKEICNIPIIGDFKIMDVPHIATSIVKKGIEAGLDGFIICGICGPDVIQDCMKIAEERMIFIFTEFTHSSGLINHELSNFIAQIAKDLKVYGIQAPATKHDRVRKLRNIVGNELLIISCGVGKQGVVYGNAIKYGADYEIIGRSIYLSDNPKLEAQKAKNKILQLEKEIN